MAEDTGDDSDGHQRRTGDRAVAVSRVIKLTTDRGEQLCRIRNISGAGVLLQAIGEYWVGELVTLELFAGRQTRGNIVWVADGRVGVAFEAPLEPVPILSDDTDSLAHVERVAISAPTTLCLHGTMLTVEVEDISVGGMKIVLDRPDSVGASVGITLDGLPSIIGTLRWQQGRYAGIEFEQQLDLDILAAWLASRW
jgi:hypothetical protein